MRVMPQTIGTGTLDVDEFVGRIPDLNLSEPMDGNAVQAETIANFSTRLDLVGTDRKDFEAQPGRCQLFQVVRIGKVGEHFVDGARNPLLPFKGVYASAHLLLEFGNGDLVGFGRAENWLTAAVGYEDVSWLITGAEKLDHIFFVTAGREHSDWIGGPHFDPLELLIGKVHALTRHEGVGLHNGVRFFGGENLCLRVED